MARESFAIRMPHDAPPLDVAAFRAEFPSLASGIAHFDNPGGTQTPAVVGEAIARTLTGPLSQRGSGLVSQRNAEHAVHGSARPVADLLGGVPGGVVHGRSATALTYDFSRTLARDVAAGDEIVVSQLDHDSNVRPWIQAAERAGVTVRWLRLDPATAELDLSVARRGDHRPHPARRGHRRLQPARHPPAGRPHRAARARGRCAGLRRRGAPRRPRGARPRGDGRRPPGLLALQVLRPALRRARRRPGAARDAAPRQAAAVDRRRARALRAGDAALRDARRRRPRRSTSSRPRARGRLPPRAAGGGVRARSATTSSGCADASRRASPLSATTSPSTRAPPTAPRRCSSPCATGSPSTRTTPWRSATSSPRPARSTRTRPSARSGSPSTSGLRIGLAAYNDDAEVDRLLEGLTDFFG